MKLDEGQLGVALTAADRVHFITAEATDTDVDPVSQQIRSCVRLLTGGRSMYIQQ